MVSIPNFFVYTLNLFTIATKIEHFRNWIRNDIEEGTNAEVIFAETGRPVSAKTGVVTWDDTLYSR
jgi:hypothetical protein